jgi:hypothetical protein
MMTVRVQESALTDYNKFSNIGAALLLAVMATLMIHQARSTSMTWDEGHHLFDGYTVIKHSDYRLNPEVPPLVKVVAAIPLLFQELTAPINQGRETQTEAYLDGREFLLKNGYDRVLIPARIACMSFTLLLGLLIFTVTRRMFSAVAGLVALAFFAFDPNFLAHGALVTTDVASSCMLLASVYAWYRYSKAPSWAGFGLVCIAVSAALVVKFTGIFVLPTLLLLSVFEAFCFRSLRMFARHCAALAGVALVGWVMLWGAYGFHYRPVTDNQKLNSELASYLPKLPNKSDELRLGFVARHHLLPEACLWGLANAKITADVNKNYLFGKVYRHSDWRYFPVAFLIKSTLPFLLLVLCVPLYYLPQRWRRSERQLAYMLLPAMFYLLIAMTSGMNIGIRHLLPIYPFLYILGAGAAVMMAQQNHLWWGVIAMLLIWHGTSSLRSGPGYMGYGNEAWGGSDNVHAYLSDSNTDWGQQLKEVKQYIDQHHIQNCWMAYFVDGVTEPSDYGISCKRLPTEETLWWMDSAMDVSPTISGTIFISDSDLEGIELGSNKLNPYDSFRALKPTAIIQHGMFVYDGTFHVALASGLVHAQHALDALYAKHLLIAKTEADEAVTLAPESAMVLKVAGDVAAAGGDIATARAHYNLALQVARHDEPSLQTSLASELQKKVDDTNR